MQTVLKAIFHYMLILIIAAQSWAISACPMVMDTPHNEHTQHMSMPDHHDQHNMLNHDNADDCCEDSNCPMMAMSHYQVSGYSWLQPIQLTQTAALVPTLHTIVQYPHIHYRPPITA